MLEPYEGKLSRTVLRGGRSGNAPLPLGAVASPLLTLDVINATRYYRPRDTKLR